MLLKDSIAKNLAFSERPVDREFKSHQPHVIFKNTTDAGVKHNMKNVYGGFLILTLLLIAVTGCIGQDAEDVPLNFIDVNVSQAKEMIDSGEFFLLDVRTQGEYNEGHINGSTLIPVELIESKLDEIPKDEKILVYCRSGRRSAQASQILVDNGFKQVYNMKGGIIEWTNSDYEVEK